MYVIVVIVADAPGCTCTTIFQDVQLRILAEALETSARAMGNVECYPTLLPIYLCPLPSLHFQSLFKTCARRACYCYCLSSKRKTNMLLYIFDLLLHRVTSSIPDIHGPGSSVLCPQPRDAAVAAVWVGGLPADGTARTTGAGGHCPPRLPPVELVRQ